MDYQSRRQVQGEATRLAILDAAIRLTRQVGFDKMTIRDICTAAGVTTGAFYHHFSSKEDLVAHAFSSLDGYMEKALAPYRSEPAAQQLDRLLRLYARYMEDMGWQTMAFYYIRRLSDPHTWSPPTATPFVPWSAVWRSFTEKGPWRPLWTRGRPPTSFTAISGVLSSTGSFTAGNTPCGTNWSRIIICSSTPSEAEKSSPPAGVFLAPF